MTKGLFTTIAVTGFTVAFFHAALPTHWLPFVLAGRAQRWKRPKTLAIAAFAGSGHVLFTTLLGVLVVWFGIALNKKIGDWFPRIAGGVLILFGLYYIWRQLAGQGHGHAFGNHSHHGNDEHVHNNNAADKNHGERDKYEHNEKSLIAVETGRLAHLEQPPATSDRVAILSLL